MNFATQFYQGVFILIVSLLSKVAVCQQTNDTTRIVGGYATTIKAEPYIVQLLYYGEQACGGSLIARRWVISAAHCTSYTRPSDWTIRGGATYTSGGVIRRVVKIVSPSEFSWSTLHYDVTMLKLAKAMTGRNIKLIPLATSGVPIGVNVKVSGWGTTSEGGSSSRRLRSVQVRIISKSVCAKKYKEGGESLTSTMFCAAKPNKDACQGDSGGPLVYRKRLYGIVSWGIGCARRKYPGVYTSVNQVRSFIRKARKL